LIYYLILGKTKYNHTTILREDKYNHTTILREDNSCPKYL